MTLPKLMYTTDAGAWLFSQSKQPWPSSTGGELTDDDIRLKGPTLRNMLLNFDLSMFTTVLSKSSYEFVTIAAARGSACPIFSNNLGIPASRTEVTPPGKSPLRIAEKS